jgi:hypothetical protein
LEAAAKGDNTRQMSGAKYSIRQSITKNDFRKSFIQPFFQKNSKNPTVLNKLIRFGFSARA